MKLIYLIAIISIFLLYKSLKFTLETLTPNFYKKLEKYIENKKEFISFIGFWIKGIIYIGLIVSTIFFIYKYQIEKEKNIKIVEYNDKYTKQLQEENIKIKNENKFLKTEIIKKKKELETLTKYIKENKKFYY